MHYKQAENLFREYLERQGWQYWTEAEFRRQLGLNKGDAAPDFTILDASGAPRALVEVSGFDIDSYQKDIECLEGRGVVGGGGNAPVPKIFKEAKQLHKVIMRNKYERLPAMLVIHDLLGIRTFQLHLRRPLFGTAIAFQPAPDGKEELVQVMVLSQGLLSKNPHLSAIAVLRTERVKAHLSGFEQEIRQIKYKNFRDFINKYQKIYKKYCHKRIDVEEKIPVLEIYQNPSANVPWGRELWGQFDRVWGLIDEKNYGLVYNGLLPAHAGILEGVSLPDPVHSSRASGFYDE